MTAWGFRTRCPLEGVVNGHCSSAKVKVPQGGPASDLGGWPFPPTRASPKGQVCSRSRGWAGTSQGLHGPWTESSLAQHPDLFAVVHPQ